MGNSLRRLEQQRRIQDKIKASETPKSDRKVWVLPIELIDRIVNYQEAQLLPSEVAAARDLLDVALKVRGFE